MNQKQQSMFPEIDLENVDAGDLIGVTAWSLHRDERPPEPGWYEVNDHNSARGEPHEVERRQLVRRAKWTGGDWVFPTEEDEELYTNYRVLAPGSPVGHITLYNIVWRGLKAPWPHA